MKFDVQKKARRERALARLINQLETNQKNDKQGNPVPLTPNDVERINQQIAILKTRI
jgi:hypothetical protein